jgi:dihydroxyacid dehydratase/phosphogluconate dehydratase
MSEDVLNRYVQNGGVYDTISNLVEEKTLKRDMYNVNDNEWEKYIEKHGSDDFVSRYIKYCE